MENKTLKEMRDDLFINEGIRILEHPFRTAYELWVEEQYQENKNFLRSFGE